MCVFIYLQTSYNLKLLFVRTKVRPQNKNVFTNNSITSGTKQRLKQLNH